VGEQLHISIPFTRYPIRSKSHSRRIPFFQSSISRCISLSSNQNQTTEIIVIETRTQFAQQSFPAFLIIGRKYVLMQTPE